MIGQSGQLAACSQQLCLSADVAVVQWVLKLEMFKCVVADVSVFAVVALPVAFAIYSCASCSSRSRYFSCRCCSVCMKRVHVFS